MLIDFTAVPFSMGRTDFVSMSRYQFGPFSTTIFDTVYSVCLPPFLAGQLTLFVAGRLMSLHALGVIITQPVKISGLPLFVTPALK